MDRQRTSDDIRTVGDLLTLFKGAEKITLLCEGGREGDDGVQPGCGGTKPKGQCRANLMNRGVKKIENNGQGHLVRCKYCGRITYLDAGRIAAAVLQLQAMRSSGMTPAIGTFPDYGVDGVIERPLPDGRKLIIARPRSAGARSGPV